MNFYLFPPSNYSSIQDEVFMHLSENINYLKTHENISIPSGFYEKVDCNGTIFYEFVSDMESDASKLFLLTIRELTSFEKSYQEIYNSKEEFALVVFCADDYAGENKNILIYDIKKQEGDDTYIPNDITKAYRHYLCKNCSTYADYAKRAPSCFPDLFFHDNAFQKANKLGTFKNVFRELTRHLVALNDTATFLYPKYQANGTLLRLKSNHNIYCSGKGSNESNDYKIKMTYNDKNYTLSCQPHTKLFGSHTDQRIYFCWGQDEIEHHAIIIVQIGDHFYQ